VKRRRLIISSLILAILLAGIAFPLGSLPPFATLFNPQTGIWAPSAPQSNVVLGQQSITVSENGSSAQVVVDIDPNGFVRVASNQTWAMYYEQGYQTAKFRLTQMDFTRRLAEGNLSGIVGSTALSSDEFYRTLLMYPVATEIVDNLSKSSPTYLAIREFTAGVNSYISTITPSTVPLLFKLLNYFPTPWTMEDAYVVQQLLAWQLSSSFDPLFFNYALEKMPVGVIAGLYPAYPGSLQYPIEPSSLNPGIYTETGDLANLSLNSPTIPGLNLSSDSLDSLTNPPTSNNNKANLIISQLWSQINTIRSAFQEFVDKGSNDWAVSSNLTGGGAILASDPHLSITVPSIWIGFQLVGPGENVIGVSFPGTPGVVLGHNPYIAWGATDSNVQATYFYYETLNPSNKNQYMHDGQWTNFNILNESVQVAGSSPVKISVESAVNGVLIPGWNNTIALDWTGLYPSDEVSAVLALDVAHNVTAAQDALINFKVGIQNWAVADSEGNVGIFTYGYYPVIERGNPRGVLPGNGSYDWVGSIPTADQPYLLDPARGFVFSANQIQVSPNYPYYIGWDYESGYRAAEIFSVLNSTAQRSINSTEKLQLSDHDYSSNLFLGPLLKALQQSNYSSVPETDDLAGWNGNMDLNSSAASIYYFWLNSYLNDTFVPYMQVYNITSDEGLYSTTFFVASNAIDEGPLIEDLANWTVNYPTIQWFNNPVNGQKRNATSLMIQAFGEALEELTTMKGNYSQTAWAWGNVHTRYDPNLFGLLPLDGPTLPAAGDDNTPNAAYGLNSTQGPSWRQVTDMGQPLSSSFGIYPGGLSENYLSPYYSNTVQDWNNGVYYTLIPQGLPGVFYYLYPGGSSSA
jgi:penicillin G amidase